MTRAARGHGRVWIQVGTDSIEPHNPRHAAVRSTHCGYRNGRIDALIPWVNLRVIPRLLRGRLRKGYPPGVGTRRPSKSTMGRASQTVDWRPNMGTRHAGERRSFGHALNFLVSLAAAPRADLANRGLTGGASRVSRPVRQTFRRKPQEKPAHLRTYLQRVRPASGGLSAAFPRPRIASRGCDSIRNASSPAASPQHARRSTDSGGHLEFASLLVALVKGTCPLVLGRGDPSASGNRCPGRPLARGYPLAQVPLLVGALSALKARCVPSSDDAANEAHRSEHHRYPRRNKPVHECGTQKHKRDQHEDAESAYRAAKIFHFAPHTDGPRGYKNRDRSGDRYRNRGQPRKRRVHGLGDLSVDTPASV